MSTRTHVRAFAPFIALAVLHVVVLVSRIPIANASLGTKALLMPALALAAGRLLRGSHPGARARLALALALALSWAGDVLVGMPGDGFVVGLAAFLLALVGYTVVIGRWAGVSRPRAWALVYPAWYAALLIVLLPYVGALAAPIVVYGLALGTLAIVASGAGRVIAAGGAVFLASDTLLALKLFLPGFAGSVWQVDAIIMVLYAVGQGLLVAGIVRRLSRTALAQRALARRATRMPD
ncbi:lysoplasmalogenase [Galbitalea sp. SE-J8]|uniref:lysoplasmalogenase n=1 Tax=Galbitalea sp. SE-J8 TaxID=3054952 RepID=UPI00259CFD8E|nr:lysoplasmalogenase [Galbitalea sp. SE-J8]MDM4762596.1 lysoplasmalogenase [Galbitalea sp. SE-J8]